MTAIAPVVNFEREISKVTMDLRTVIALAWVPLVL